MTRAIIVLEETLAVIAWLMVWAAIILACMTLDPEVRSFSPFAPDCVAHSGRQAGTAIPPGGASLSRVAPRQDKIADLLSNM